MGSMTDYERQVFILNRLGFGAGAVDRKALMKSSWVDLREALLAELKDADTFSPFPFLKQDTGEPAVRFANLRDWWISEMVCSPHVLRERMVIFWHDHFAVDVRSTSPQIQMLQYLSALRKDPLGSFEENLKRMTRDPAFMKFLNIQDLTKRKPNENFGRELLELYTLGIGNYSEADIKGASRALTGWGMFDNWRRSKLPEMDRLKMLAEDKYEWTGFVFRPDQHDDGDKTILGQTRKWGGSELLDYLAQHPQTARYITGKLFFHFVGRQPTESENNILAKEFQRSGTQIRPVIRKMTELPGFWEPGTEGMKTPAEFVVGINRSAGLGEFIRNEMGEGKNWKALPAKRTRTATRGMASQMNRMGMDLLAPFDVSGFPKGSQWINTSNAVVRRSVRPQLLDERRDNRSYPGPGYLTTAESLMLKLKDGKEPFIEEFCVRYGAEKNGSAYQALVSQNFVLRPNSNINQVCRWLDRAWGALCASPDFQMR